MLDHVLSALFRILAAVAGLIIGAMALLITADVVGRNLELGNLPWLNEIIEYALYVMTLLAAPWVLRLGAHVRMNLLAAVLPRAAGRFVDLAANTVGLAVSAALVWYGYLAAQQALARGSLIIKTLIFPEWLLLVVMPFSLALLALEFGMRIVRALRGETVALPETEMSGVG